jgi:hypothetical protein
MLVWCPFHKARSREEFRGFSAWSSTDKDVIDGVNGGGEHENDIGTFLSGGKDETGGKKFGERNL